MKNARFRIPGFKLAVAVGRGVNKKDDFLILYDKFLNLKLKNKLTPKGLLGEIYKI